MDYLSANIAANLKRMRKSRNMSLDAVAELCGVSKSMLAQIERGETNPTVTTLGRIASGMRIDFKELIEAKYENDFFLSGDKMSPLKKAENEYRIYSCLPYNKKQDFEVYRIEVEEGKCYESAPIGENALEYVLMAAGKGQVETGNRAFDIKDKDMVSFVADKEHSFKNTGQGTAVFIVFSVSV